MKNRDFYRVTIALLVVLLICTIIYSFLYLEGDKTNSDIQPSYYKKPPEYHFSLIVPDIHDWFWKLVCEGAKKAGEDMNASVDFKAPEAWNMEQELQYFDMAIASKVDGIVTYVTNEEKFTPYINTAKSKNIPVITILEDAKGSRRDSFVGINSFEMGSMGGKLIVEGKKGKANVAIILDEFTKGNDNIIQDLKIEGFKDSIKGYPDIHIVTTQHSKSGIWGSEEIMQKILFQYPEIDAVFCTSAQNTIGVAQIIVDFNRVADITVIGYGDLPDILNYIRKGVIYGTVISDPYKIGYKSIEKLIEVKKNSYASSFVYTDLEPITNENIEEYLKSIEKRKE